jgi:hypothetical protein
MVFLNQMDKHNTSQEITMTTLSEYDKAFYAKIDAQRELLESLPDDLREEVAEYADYRCSMTKADADRLRSAQIALSRRR